MSGYLHHLRVRYGECDMQGVVFNAHYLAYCDDAVDCWFRAVVPGGLYSAEHPDAGFDFMVKTTSIVWSAPLVFGDCADLACEVSRWGTTSFDITITGAVGGEDRFVVTATYVSVDAGSRRPSPVPADVRTALSQPL